MSRGTQKQKVIADESQMSVSIHFKAIGDAGKASKRTWFYYHVSKLCQKDSNKLYALARISPYMDQNKLRNLMTAFIYSQFQYCPFVWMFHGRQLNQKINKIQGRL